MRNPLLIIFFVLFAFSCKNNTEKINPTIESISESVYASGIIKSKNQYQVFASVNGLVDNIFVSEGDTVKPGSPILSLVNETSKLNTENARLAADFADLNSNKQKLVELQLAIDLAKSKYNNDSLLYKRQEKLWNDKIGSKVELEQRELAFANSKTALESAIIRYNDLKKTLNFNSEQSKNNFNISKTVENDFLVRSKINGKIYGLLKEKGEMVTTQTPLAIIGDASEFILELQVDEYDIVKVRTGKKVFVTLDSYKGQLFEAVITKIYPLMNERSKTFTAEAEFTQQPPVLYPNLTLEATILIQTKEKALTVPRSYIFQEEYVVNADGEKIKVKLGLKDYQKAEVLEGLSKDDEIVIPQN
ncbi:MAG: HlyD family efflux transporter periplasmic adaptor subunit [Bacteroidetes bacterium]|nr:MAG: HlyD family efflux transporter periplasmic adaptor subunit [Bacteroidota bacterium]